MLIPPVAGLRFCVGFCLVLERYPRFLGWFENFPFDRIPYSEFFDRCARSSGDRASASGAESRWFESSRAYQKAKRVAGRPAALLFADR
jgi:hypothetical protein